MNSLLIHLSGYLSAEMGSELYLKVKESSQTPTLFCFDCSKLTSLDAVGAEYWKKISTRVKGTASKVSLIGCLSSFQDALLANEVENLFPSFSNEREAKLYLESQILPTEPANESLHQSSKSKETKNENSSNSKFIFCPVCTQSLKLEGVGDYLCPKCKNKFFVNKRGWTSLYEKLV